MAISGDTAEARYDDIGTSLFNRRSSDEVYNTLYQCMPYIPQIIPEKK